MNKKYSLLVCSLAVVILVSCAYASSPGSKPIPLKNVSAIVQSTAALTPTFEPFLPSPIPTERVFIPTTTPAPSKSTEQPSSEILNPLTGLPVSDPALLQLSPALVSVSNFPISVRPQSGLSFAPHVYEMTIGEGMTRFLAVYYGNYGNKDTENIGLGSVRSGRLPYEQLRNMYDGYVIMAGASPEVGSKLAATHFRETVNFATIKSLAEDRTNRMGAPAFGQINFAAQPQANGLQGDLLNITWSYLNRVRWTYDPDSGKYLREQDKSDGSGKFFPAIDKLTDEQLSFDNVVVMAAEHDWQTPTRIEMNLLYVKKEPAVFFRDGKAYPIFWTSLAPLGPIRFMNPDGTPFPYKPGNTWYEIIESIHEINQMEDQSWSVRFVTPK